jgi:molybdenum cofactor cytidylyltransferase
MLKEPTAGIILAAGMSRRLGRPKQLVHVGGRFLLHWAIEAALRSRLERVVLVLGHEAPRILETLGSFLRDPRFGTVINERYGEGMAQSLRTGLLAVKEAFPSAMFLLGDQPLVDAPTIDLLLVRFRTSRRDICVPVHQGQRGHPVLFSEAMYDSILALKGDVGARELIRANPDRVLLVELEGPQGFLDVDTAGDLDRLVSKLDVS